MNDAPVITKFTLSYLDYPTSGPSNQTVGIDEAIARAFWGHALQKILKSGSSETLSKTFFTKYFLRKINLA